MELTPWNKYTLLSFDGGGMRGYASLLILEALMNHISQVESDPEAMKEEASVVPEVPQGINASSFHPQYRHSSVCEETETNALDNFLPCHYFDCIIGTSTGGLIAIMLGRLRMTVSEAKSQYESLGGDVFGSPRLFNCLRLPPFFWPRSKYDHLRLEDVVKGVVKQYDSSLDEPNGFPNASFSKTEHDLCKTVVTSVGKVFTPGHKPVTRNDKTYLFQTYDSPTLGKPGDLNPKRAFKGPVWTVARACTAAPTYFDPEMVEALNGNLWYFKDGGMRVNNPCRTGVDELVSWGPENNPDGAIDSVVSIGTGYHYYTLFGSGTAGGLSDTLAAITGAAVGSTDTEDVHDQLRKQFGLYHERKYWRFNSDSPDWQNIRLDQCDGKTMEKMRTLISNYVQRHNTEEELRACARRLVRCRRQRYAADPDKWERFALASQYRCMMPGCFSRYDLGSDFRHHFEHSHPAGPALEASYERLIWKHPHLKVSAETIMPT
ncbi:Acyl transferase/acyl hydrolase/lysophospholipase [Metarhizium guizhouense ARSEF 977]|uniref:Acyl transferase/acyl hydrolase/lysophospholipase n=1 Tax=Metarhizium guizhouense (strain ARSEF 977) TaxID=1276136 RepID=A0A0B4GI75_METGA|nr:Acyl transferase/acyl hydrolase/lysophospholipase [Metarhizium guizhouense ARSEF 977]